tara:strand:+ start:114 stop:611 length:498 start_codon:yes stop_codon:yes gene_type:complete
MWWSRLLAAIVVAVLLAGCGFRPLYGTAGENRQVAAQLAQIRIQTIPDRTGQKLRNFLLDRLNPNGQPAQPLYYLQVTINVSRTDLGIERDETATRALLMMTANYQLIDRARKVVLVEGSTQSTNSFNIVASDFATLSAETDATERATREVSDDIKTRLALYFTR